jgi:hypothetical protein
MRRYVYSFILSNSGIQVRVYLEFGLEALDLRFDVTHEAVARGFFARADTYLWGILAFQCVHQEPETATTAGHDLIPLLPKDVCDARSRITLLAGSIHLMLSLASLCAALTISLLVLSSSPMAHLKMTIAAYAGSVVLMLTPILVFEFGLMNLWEQPDLWGIYDHNIHMTLAGIDHPQSVPQGLTYNHTESRISRILVWTACVSMIASFLCFLLRVVRGMKNKQYLNPVNDFLRPRQSVILTGKSMIANQASSSSL